MEKKKNEVLDGVMKLSELGVVMAMTPEERVEVMKAGFDYTKKTRRMPTLSEACIQYMETHHNSPPDREKE